MGGAQDSARREYGPAANKKLEEKRKKIYASLKEEGLGTSPLYYHNNNLQVTNRVEPV